MESLDIFLSEFSRAVIEHCSVFGLDADYLSYRHSLDAGTLKVRVSCEYFEHEDSTHADWLTTDSAADLLATLTVSISNRLQLAGIGQVEGEAA